MIPNHLINNCNKNSGYLLILVLVFGSIFFTIISSFVVFSVTQSKLISQKFEQESAGQIAEAGLDYYRWYLAHYPNDVTNGTGLPGPYIGIYKDPEGGAIGEYSLSIASTTYCGDVSSIDVTSVGHTYKEPNVKRTINAHYSKPNVAEYAFILNSNVWAGADRVVNGPYHSNGGIRFDGKNNSVVTSGQATWSCTGSFGCSPTGNRNGVFTTTGNPITSLFAFPSAPINFAGITVDLSRMQTKAQTGGGIYIPASGAYGYHVTFNVNGTVTVKKVTQTYSYNARPDGATDTNERNIIQTEVAYNTYAISNTCPLIFIKDKIWLDGTVKNKVTLAAADVGGSANPSIILSGNLNYVSATTSGLLAIAEQDILVGVDVPDDMTSNGIYIAQNGRFARNHYISSDLPDPTGPLNFRPYYERNSHTINGTIVSNLGGGTQWTNGGTFKSGFHNRYNNYDRNLVENPPPLIPTTSDVYKFSNWQDKN